MKKLLLIFFYGILLLRCKSSTKQNDAGQYSLSSIYYWDTLTLFARYNECGEFGGHTEVFRIYQSEKNEIYADYKKDTLDCKDRATRKIIYSQTFKLDRKVQQLVIRYLGELLNQNFIDKGFVGHAGEYYSAISSDSSLVISHYTDHYEGFNKLRDEILNN
jgi:hypothetical protein